MTTDDTHMALARSEFRTDPDERVRARAVARGEITAEASRHLDAAACDLASSDQPEPDEGDFELLEEHYLKRSSTAAERRVLALIWRYYF